VSEHPSDAGDTGFRPGTSSGNCGDSTRRIGRPCAGRSLGAGRERRWAVDKSVAIWCRTYAEETDYGRTHRQALQEAHAKVGEYRHQQRREEEQCVAD